MNLNIENGSRIMKTERGAEGEVKAKPAGRIQFLDMPGETTATESSSSLIASDDSGSTLHGSPASRISLLSANEPELTNLTSEKDDAAVPVTEHSEATKPHGSEIPLSLSKGHEESSVPDEDLSAVTPTVAESTTNSSIDLTEPSEAKELQSMTKNDSKPSNSLSENTEPKKNSPDGSTLGDNPDTWSDTVEEPPWEDATADPVKVPDKTSSVLIDTSNSTSISDLKSTINNENENSKEEPTIEEPASEETKECKESNLDNTVEPPMVFSSVTEKLNYEEKQLLETIDQKHQDIMRQQLSFLFSWLIHQCSINPTLNDLVLQEHKSWKRCFHYMENQAYEMSPEGARATLVTPDAVFTWIYDYYMLDDLAEIKKESEEAEKQRKAAEEARKTAEQNAEQRKKEKAEAAKKLEEKKKAEIQQISLFDMMDTGGAVDAGL